MSFSLGKICGCLLNVSEAQNLKLVETIAQAAVNKSSKTTNSEGSAHKSDAVVLNIFNDPEYNRSVITIAAEAKHIGSSVIEACKKAYEVIDLRHHKGGHPRLGAVDLVPIHPLGPDVSLDECGQIARDIADALAQDVPGTSFFLFGNADLPQRRGLVERRKQVKWYDGKYGGHYGTLSQNVGAKPQGRYGFTGIGAIPYVTNCNVTIDTQDAAFGRSIAASLRATSKNGLPGVQAMAFPHQGMVEIACNVQGIFAEDPENDLHTAKHIQHKTLMCSFGKYYHVPARVIEDRVRDIASERGISTIGTSLVGFIPEEAQRLAVHAMQTGQVDYWKSRQKRTM